MVFLWLATAVSLLLALVACVYAYGTARRLDKLAEMYWELKYQYSELRGQTRSGADVVPRTDKPQVAAGAPADDFIPVTSLKR
jgi:hypothetical protein